MAYEIERGPGSLDLLLSLAESDRNYRKPVMFTLNVSLGKPSRSTKMQVEIYSLERANEGSTTHDWVFKGFEVDVQRSTVRLQKVEDTYSTLTNRGEVTLLKG